MMWLLLCRQHSPGKHLKLYALMQCPISQNDFILPFFRGKMDFLWPICHIQRAWLFCHRHRTHIYIYPLFQPTILCWAQAHSLANCNLYSSINVLHWNLSTTTTTTSLYFYTYSMVVYIPAYMVPSFKVAYPSSWSHFSQTRSRPASYFSITTITASREKFESEVKYWAALITRSANMLMTGEMEVLLEDNRR